MYIIYDLFHSLLVLGMDHYGSSAWKIIQERLLPTKTPKQVRLVLITNMYMYIHVQCT